MGQKKLDSTSNVGAWAGYVNPEPSSPVASGGIIRGGSAIFFDFACLYAQQLFEPLSHRFVLSNSLGAENVTRGGCIRSATRPNGEQTIEIKHEADLQAWKIGAGSVQGG